MATRPKRARSDAFVVHDEDDEHDYDQDEDATDTTDDTDESSASEADESEASSTTDESKATAEPSYGGFRADSYSDFERLQSKRVPIFLRDEYPVLFPRFDFEVPAQFIDPLCFEHHADRPLYVDHFRFVSRFKCPIYGHVAPYVLTVFADGKCNLIHPNAFLPGEPYSHLFDTFASFLKVEMQHDFSDTLTEAWLLLMGPTRNVLPEIFVDQRRVLFCSLCAHMHSAESFSAEQRKQPPQTRECIAATYNGDPMGTGEGDETHHAGFRKWWLRGIENRKLEGDPDEIIKLAAIARNDRDKRIELARARRDQRSKA